MKKWMLSSLILSFSLAGSANNSVVQATEDALSYMNSVFASTYAPAPWKAKYANWNLETEYRKALTSVDSKSESLDVFAARDILKDFVYSTRDYHVSIRFLSTEKATLPLTIRSAEGKYFIVDIDREKLGEESFPYNVGDELITFDGRPAGEVVAEIRAGTQENVPTTDQALAELSLTSRKAARGFAVPHGPVTLGILRKDETEVSSRQIIWEYTEEQVLPFKAKTKDFMPKIKPIIPRFKMIAQESTAEPSPQGLGAKKSYLPSFGETIWEADDSESFQAYIYRDENNKMIGVVRIPAYYFESDDNEVYNNAVLSFERIIQKMEKFTDALVIDQLNNPGGSVFYLYALASMLSPQPMRTPRHTMSILPTDVAECVRTLEQFKDIKNDEEAKKIAGENINGYPVSYQTVEFYRNYCRNMKEDWANGQTMSRPFWIAGVDQLNPYKTTYSKPIMVMVNELDFSGGDFFPTILQDNKRATIFGVRTAGAGGYVNDINFPNVLGVEAFRVTQSIAHRVDDTPIENLGVTPDVTYEMTAHDRQNNYEDYVKAAKAALQKLL